MTLVEGGAYMDFNVGVPLLQRGRTLVQCSKVALFALCIVAALTGIFLVAASFLVVAASFFKPAPRVWVVGAMCGGGMGMLRLALRYFCLLAELDVGQQGKR